LKFGDDIGKGDLNCSKTLSYAFVQVIISFSIRVSNKLNYSLHQTHLFIPNHSYKVARLSFSLTKLSYLPSVIYTHLFAILN